MESSLRYQQSRYTALLGAGKNLLLALLKIIFGITGHSHALLADGVHSLSDLLIDAIVLIASRFGSKGADHDHPYGHGRIETAATVLLALVLLLAGIGIIYNAITEILDLQTVVAPRFYVLLIAFLSILINEVLYFYTKIVGERIKSKLLLANAWHHRSDSASSVIVLIGVIAAWFGFAKFDALAAIIVGLMIMQMAWRFGFTSIRELVDTGLEDHVIAEIETLIRQVPGVSALHQLRSRLVGGDIFLDVHIQVNPVISVSEGHFIAQQVHNTITQKIADVTDVMVHIDPEDDETGQPSRDLMSRMELTKLLKERWSNQPVAAYLDTVSLHYLSGKLKLELRLPATWLNSDIDPQQLLYQLRQDVADLPNIADIKLVFVW